jgi:hypothetical protein
MELVLCSDKKQTFALQPAPDSWIHLHSVATGASLAAGAIAYTLTHVAGTTATKTASNTISIVGSIVAHGTRLVAGDIAGFTIQSGANTAAYLVQQGGDVATQMSALLASSVAAVAVGSSFLLGNTVYQIYKKSRISSQIPEPSLEGMSLIESIEELPDTILLELTNTNLNETEDTEGVQSVLSPNAVPMLEDIVEETPIVPPTQAPKSSNPPCLST